MRGTTGARLGPRLTRAAAAGLLTLTSGCAAVADALGVGAGTAPRQLPRSLPAGDDVEAVVVDLVPSPTGQDGPVVLSGGLSRCGSLGDGFEAVAGGERPPYELGADVVPRGWASAAVRVPDPAPEGSAADATASVVPLDGGPPVTLPGEAVLSRDGVVFLAGGYPRLEITVTCR